MSEHVAQRDLVRQLAASLPPSRMIPLGKDGYWNLLRVNRSRIVSEMADTAQNVAKLKSMDLPMLRILGEWFGERGHQLLDDLVLGLAQRFTVEPAEPAAQVVMLLREFIHNRPSEPIERMASLLLAKDHRHELEVLEWGDLRDYSRRFCFALLVYAWDPDKVPLLMLYETAERAGYKRFNLSPKTESRGRTLDDDTVQEVERKIRAGADLNQLTVSRTDDILLRFEGAGSGYKSDCLDLFRAPEYRALEYRTSESRESEFKDSGGGETLLFILRYLRESSIRQVDRVIFANKAEWIVLRFYNRGRTLEAHSTSAIGPRIATAVAADLLAEKNLNYLADTQSTDREAFVEFIRKLREAEDTRLRLQELYLENAPAPVADAPVLILRCGKDRTLAEPLASLKEKGLDLLGDLNNIRNINVAFTVERGIEVKVYIFKIYCHEVSSSRFFLPYRVANIALDIRKEFEEYLFVEHEVRVIPGSGRRPRQTGS